MKNKIEAIKYTRSIRKIANFKVEVLKKHKEILEKFPELGEESSRTRSNLFKVSQKKRRLKGLSLKNEEADS